MYIIYLDLKAIKKKKKPRGSVFEYTFSWRKNIIYERLLSFRIAFNSVRSVRKTIETATINNEFRFILFFFFAENIRT